MSDDCRCASEGFPLASFCEDDLRCPQCGGWVAWLNSDNLLPKPEPFDVETSDPTIFWVYATELGGRGNRFTFSLKFEARDENRLKRPHRLVLDESRCRVEPHNWPYTFSLEVVDDQETDKVKVRLKPDPRLVKEYGEDDWWVQEGLMPVGGVFCTLTLVGNCGKKVFGLLVCGEPVYEIEVRENGQAVPDAPDDAGESVKHAWPISRRGPHVLNIAIRCVKGYLRLPVQENENADQNPLVRTPPEGNFTVQTSVPVSRILGPGLKPCCELTVGFDSRGWNQGDLVSLNVGLVLNVLKSDQIPIHLYLKPRGDVGFRPQRELRVRPMYYGEVEWSQPEGTAGAAFTHVKIFNRGERALRVRRPTVVPETLAELGWIDVKWVKTEPPVPDPATLDVEGPGHDLSVGIDLSRVTPLHHPPGRPLRATILVEGVQDDRPDWELPVLVELVEMRPELKSPLAIDFGNSNTYAAVVDGGVLKSVLGGGDPENFPTALHFDDLPDPALARLVIGREAVGLGDLYPGSLVRWRLKRWLLADAKDWETPYTIRTRRGQSCELDRAELILLFIEKVIRECETALRRTVTRVGLSYPANYGPRARKRFDQVIARLEERRKAAFPHLAAKVRVERVATINSAPDEASAVAIGFVYDKGHYPNEMEPHLGPDKTFLLASFDFGGGSIDSALLRFQRVGSGPLNFRSEHLSFGGDESFGGDNVTTAVSLLLLGRFRALLGATAPGSEFDVSGGIDGRDSGQDSGNHDLLRVLADELKRYLCHLADARAAEPPPPPPAPPGGPDPTATARPRPSPAGNSPELQRLKTAVSDFLGRVKVRNRDSGQIAPLNDAGSLDDPFREAMLGVTLDDVYGHPIPGTRDPESYYTVRERVEKSIDQLHGFVTSARGKPGLETVPLFIVLAGAACRLPLVRTLLMARFDGPRLFEDRARPKSKVAFGLARYLDYLIKSPARIKNLSRAGEYTHGPIVWNAGLGETVIWVPTCHPLTLGDWLPLKDVPLILCLDESRKVSVYHDAYEPELIGTFDLSVPAAEGEPGVSKELPATLSDDLPSEVLLKIAGRPKNPPAAVTDGSPVEAPPEVNASEDDLLLRVRYGKDGETWREFGDWRLTPAGVPDAAGGGAAGNAR